MKTKLILGSLLVALSGVINAQAPDWAGAANTTGDIYRSGDVGIGPGPGLGGGNWRAKLSVDNVATTPNQALSFRAILGTISSSGLLIAGAPTGAIHTIMGVHGIANAKVRNQTQLNEHAMGIAGESYDGYTNYGGSFYAQSNGLGYNYGVYAVATGHSNAALEWSGWFNGNVYCTGSYSSSDRKLKENIKPLANSLDKILKLKPSSYNFKTEEFKHMNLPKGNQVGLISQELEEVFPEFVMDLPEFKKTDKEGKEYIVHPEFKAVQYTSLIPVLIGGMQDQQQIIEKQNADHLKQVQDLQKQLEEQKQLIADLQQKIGTTTSIGQNSLGSDGFSMEQNIPNPFSNETIIKYTMPQSVNSAYMAVYDLSGKQITTLPITKGTSSLTITSEKLAAGIYIYSIVADGKVMDSKRMVVVGK